MEKHFLFLSLFAVLTVTACQDVKIDYESNHVSYTDNYDASVIYEPKGEEITESEARERCTKMINKLNDSSFTRPTKANFSGGTLSDAEKFSYDGGTFSESGTYGEKLAGGIDEKTFLVEYNITMHETDTYKDSNKTTTIDKKFEQEAGITKYNDKYIGFTGGHTTTGEYYEGYTYKYCEETEPYDILLGQIFLSIYTDPNCTFKRGYLSKEGYVYIECVITNEDKSIDHYSFEFRNDLLTYSYTDAANGLGYLRSKIKVQYFFDYGSSMSGTMPTPNSNWKIY